jgi:hypothetical protein
VASFAAFIYSHPDDVLAINNPWQIGFDAGDEVRGVVAASRSNRRWNGFGEINVFRIDGEMQGLIMVFLIGGPSI